MEAPLLAFLAGLALGALTCGIGWYRCSTRLRSLRDKVMGWKGSTFELMDEVERW